MVPTGLRGAPSGRQLDGSRNRTYDLILARSPRLSAQQTAGAGRRRPGCGGGSRAGAHRSLLLAGSPANEAELARVRMASDDLWHAGSWAAGWLLQAMCRLTRKLAGRAGCLASDATHASR